MIIGDMAREKKLSQIIQPMMETLNAVGKMEEVSLMEQMEANTQENGKMILFMELAVSFGQMVISTRASGLKAKCMALESSSGLMDESTMASIKTTFSTDTEYTHTWTIGNIKECGTSGNNKAKVNTFCQMVKSIKEFGKTV